MLSKSEISKNDTIFVVSPNTMEDPLRCLNFCKIYNPLMLNEYKVASEPYKNDRNAEFLDVYGDHGTENKGKENNTRKVALYNLGLDCYLDKNEMPCHGLTKTFKSKESANKYIKSLFSDKYLFTVSVALEIWGFNIVNIDKTAEKIIEINDRLNFNKEF